MSTALLFGAGASRELGMPMREQLNAEILSWLNPATARSINAARRTRGVGHPDEMIEALASELAAPDFDYEDLLTRWEHELSAYAGAPRGLGIHGIYAWVAQLVSQILYRQQVSYRDSLREGLTYYAGLVRLVKACNPLWVFSLNHDVLVECMAAHFGIPLATGFGPQRVEIPCRQGGEIIARQSAELLADADMGDGRLNFLRQGELGINLLKLHGALDMFALGDTSDLIKLVPAAQSFDAVIDTLQIANEGLLGGEMTAEQAGLLNQIPYVDDAGQVSVLRRTLLASAARPTDPYPGLMQRRFLEYFRANLEPQRHLVCIGYGMGNADVNEIVTEWLGGSRQRRVELVVPRIDRVPSCLSGYAQQVILTPASATTYFEQLGAW